MTHKALQNLLFSPLCMSLISPLLVSPSHFAPTTLASLLFFEQISYTLTSGLLCLLILCLKHSTPDNSMSLLHFLQALLKYHRITVWLCSISLSLSKIFYPPILPLGLYLCNIISILFNYFVCLILPTRIYLHLKKRLLFFSLRHPFN